MDDSILTTIKRLLGIGEDEAQFDSEIMVHINSVFTTLLQLGVGPTEGFRIEDDSASWDEFMGTRNDLDSVKSYIYLKVRLLFDPPQSGPLIASLTEQLREYEWRLNDWAAPEDPV